jgi:hypothetical protein
LFAALSKYIEISHLQPTHGLIECRPLRLSRKRLVKEPMSAFGT